MDPREMLVAILILGPVGLARWPRLVALPSLIARRKEAVLPQGLTIFVTSLLSGSGMARMLATGCIAVLSAPRLVSGEDRASGYLEDALAGLVVHRPESAEETLSARMQAADILISPRTAPDPSLRVELRRIMSGLAASAGEDASGLGLMRGTAGLRRVLFVAAGVELVAPLFMDNWSSLQIQLGLFLAAAISVVCAFHLDPRTPAGVRAADELRAFSARLCEAVAKAGSFEAMEVRVLVPQAETLDELHVWALAAGCHTEGAEAAVVQLWLVSGTGVSEGGRIPTQLMSHPGIQLGFMDQIVFAYVRLVRLLTWPLRTLWRSLGRGKASPQSPLLWS